jgi:hypothetical protein
MSATIDLGPWVGVLMPVAVSAAGALISLAGSWAAYEIRKLTASRLDEAQEDAIAAEIGVVKSKAATWAGTMIAASATNLAGEKITVDSPMVATAANSIAADVSSELVAVGWSPQRIAKLVAGEIGKLQPPSLALPTPK